MIGNLESVINYNTETFFSFLYWNCNGAFFSEGTMDAEIKSFSAENSELYLSLSLSVEVFEFMFSLSPSLSLSLISLE